MSESVFAPLPPNSGEAERSVLGSMMTDPRAVNAAIEELTEDDFYIPSHREIYAAIREVKTRVPDAFKVGQLHRQ